MLVGSACLHQRNSNDLFGRPRAQTTGGDFCCTTVVGRRMPVSGCFGGRGATAVCVKGCATPARVASSRPRTPARQGRHRTTLNTSRRSAGQSNSPVSGPTLPLRRCLRIRNSRSVTHREANAMLCSGLASTRLPLDWRGGSVGFPARFNDLTGNRPHRCAYRADRDGRPRAAPRNNACVLAASLLMLHKASSKNRNDALPGRISALRSARACV